MREIPLSRGRFAIVDNADYDQLSAMAWNYNRNGYAVHTNRNGSKTLMHRLIMQAQPGQQVDHINGNPLDNRRCNLRIATHSDNQCNSRPRGRSQYKGVCYDKSNGLWKYSVQRDGKRHQGYAPTEIEAAKARDALAVKLHGDFARLNFPPKQKPAPAQMRLRANV